tara:strand:+ start:336 stop:557 length:222 start_codon:yes stop_codon:yes gene_type:complete
VTSEEHGEMQRTIGQLEGRMKALERSVGEIHSDTKAMRETIDQAKGGWKTLFLVAGVAGAAGALIGKLIPFVK